MSAFTTAEQQRDAFYVPLETIWVLESAYQVQRTDLIETLAELLMILVLHFKQREAVQATMAALWESLSQNHSFVDGNKRIAFAATFVFLRINNLRISATDEDA